MANLPANRTKLQAAVTNQQPSIIASSQANREALTEAYDTIDLLNQKTDTLVAGGNLVPYPPDFMGRQAIINGNFSVNQRVVSGTVVLTTGKYGHDRWKAGAAGCTYTFATVNNVTTITITAGSLIQVIEGLNLVSDTYTLSWAGTAQGKIGAGSYGVSGISGAVVGGTNLSIEFNAGTLSKVQFNAGTAALPFQLKSFAQELQDCLRYYEKSYAYDVAPGSNNGFGVHQTNILAQNYSAGARLLVGSGLRYKVDKRASPTISYYTDTGTANVWFCSGFGNVTLTTSFANHKGAALATVNAANVVNSSEIYGHWTADAEL